ncbi:MAG: IPT/TIG domain-containing protein [Deltaproteobacteria bacterium]|nr:IPT/TIG domain-containing protein [Deltaproteobacteria bacterium]
MRVATILAITMWSAGCSLSDWARANFARDFQCPVEQVASRDQDYPRSAVYFAEGCDQTAAYVCTRQSGTVICELDVGSGGGSLSPVAGVRDAFRRDFGCQDVSVEHLGSYRFAVQGCSHAAVYRCTGRYATQGDCRREPESPSTGGEQATGPSSASAAPPPQASAAASVITPTDSDPQPTAMTVPTISGFSPSAGPPGTDVVIDGSGFSLRLYEDRVSINGITVPVRRASIDQLVVTVPEGASDGRLVVEVTGGGRGESSGRAESPDTFTVLASESSGATQGTSAATQPVDGTAGGSTQMQSTPSLAVEDVEVEWTDFEDGWTAEITFTAVAGSSVPGCGAAFFTDWNCRVTGRDFVEHRKLAARPDIVDANQAIAARALAFVTTPLRRMPSRCEVQVTFSWYPLGVRGGGCFIPPAQQATVATYCWTPEAVSTGPC